MAEQKKKYFVRNWRGKGLKFAVGQICPDEVAEYLDKVGESGFVLTDKRPSLEKTEKTAVVDEGEVEKK